MISHGSLSHSTIISIKHISSLSHSSSTIQVTECVPSVRGTTWPGTTEILVFKKQAVVNIPLSSKGKKSGIVYSAIHSVPTEIPSMIVGESSVQFSKPGGSLLTSNIC